MPLIPSWAHQQISLLNSETSKFPVIFVITNIFLFLTLGLDFLLLRKKPETHTVMIMNEAGKLRRVYNGRENRVSEAA